MHDLALVDLEKEKKSFVVDYLKMDFKWHAERGRHAKGNFIYRSIHNIFTIDNLFAASDSSGHHSINKIFMLQ